jgi:diaminohydroxyphosphoribosylaminopyrimidine deaminase/5-amino-6-(5-phosphoribosylamino)uracil reductase
MRDEHYMEQAIELAELGRGLTHPNPLVGAVVMKDRRVVGNGYHRGPHTPHAEVVALREAGAAAAGATLYSTLEPCCHHGRTPPCVGAIIAAGVRRVVVALPDPNPLVDGRGIAELRRAGLRLTVLEGETAVLARRQNAAYLKYMRTGLPLVTYKAAVSLDGKVAAAGGDARWVSGEESRRLAHAMRARADAVLIGAGALRRDDPQLTVRLVPGRDPVAVVVSESGDVPPGAQLFAGARNRRTILLTRRLSADVEASLTLHNVEVMLIRGELADGLRELAQTGLLDILCEGGPSLATSLLERGLVDRLAVFVAPVFVGKGAPEIVSLRAPDTMAGTRRLGAVRWRWVGEDALLEADVGGV